MIINHDKKRFLDLTWVGWLNVILLQWIFIRLYYTYEVEKSNTRYGIIIPVVPLTGWWSDFIPKKNKKVLLRI